MLDFGISKLSGKLDDEGEPTLTASNMVLGSPKYFSPEQVKDAKNVDHRADVWALGLVLYYMLTGRRDRSRGETMSAVCVAIATETPPRLIDLLPDAPRELDAAVMGCLIKDPERRTQSTTDFARSIAPFASNARAALPELAPDAAISPPGALVAVGAPMSAGSIPLSGSDQRSVAMAVDATEKPAIPVLWLQIGGAVAAAGVLLLVLLLTSGDEKPTSDMGSVAPVSPAGNSEPTATSDDTESDSPPVRDRTIVVPGEDGPIKRANDDDEPKLPDIDVKAHQLGTTTTTVKLFQSIGGQDVVGVVPKGEVVVVKQIRGEWAMVLWVDTRRNRSTTGWTVRNLIE